ncbi:MAG TPA: YtcA family lipoprotein [Magnetospirillaceae bacterium]|nr:YtcA family lipoprotein [Magnetospirillaceae bacterium]
MTVFRSRVPAYVLLLAGGLAGCNAAPTQSILGSFFPSWMICALAGIAGSVAVRLILSAIRIERSVPAPLLVHLAMAAAISFAVWLLWQS